MNERIKKLAEQAGYLPDMFGIGHWDMPECKKFAQLIVQECATWINDNLGMVDEEARADLLKHFGVEE
jgi:hypothetical protein